MSSYFGFIVTLALEIGAGWIGYMLGIERGIKICKVKRRRFD